MTIQRLIEREKHALEHFGPLDKIVSKNQCNGIVNAIKLLRAKFFKITTVSFVMKTLEPLSSERAIERMIWEAIS